MRYPLRRACHIFGRSGGGASPRHFSKKNYIFFLYLWVHLHNLIKQNNIFSILKKIENPLLNPLNHPPPPHLYPNHYAPDVFLSFQFPLLEKK